MANKEEDLAWRTILVPTDFSACANSAVDLAAKLAKSQSARLVLLHVVGLGGADSRATLMQPTGESQPVSAEDYARALAVEDLTRTAAPLKARGLEVDLRVAFGPPAETILEEARALHVDAIVTGTNGRTGLAHLVVGSVAERLVRYASVPVITVRHSERSSR